VKALWSVEIRRIVGNMHDITKTLSHSNAAGLEDAMERDWRLFQRHPFPKSAQPLVSVYYEGRCIGHVLAPCGGDAFEAFDQTERTLGIFKTEDDAVTAVWRAAAH
jgi:hypothetical protein